MATSSISSRLQTTFFVILLVGVVILTFFVMRPYLPAVVLAITFAVMARPLREKITHLVGDRPAASAALTTVFVALIIMIPLGLVGTLVVDEASNLYTHLAGGGGAAELVGRVQDWLGPNAASSLLPSLVEVDRYVRELTGIVLDNVGDIFSNVVSILLTFFITLFGLYYFIKDGEKFKQTIIAFSPLKDSDDEEIIERLTGTVRAVVMGSLSVALIQGFLAGVGFAIFGVPSPVLLGTLTVVAALIPSIGTLVITLPVTSYLFFSGSETMAVGLLLWSVFLVGLVDNFLRPKFLARGMNIHPFFIFLSVLGGLQFFGPVGFLLGPLVLSFFFALIGLYQKDFRGLWEG